MIVSPGSKRRAPAKARRERDLRALHLHQRVEDHLVERAVEIAAAVQQPFGRRERLGQLRLERRADCWRSGALISAVGAATGWRTPAAAGSDSRRRAPDLHFEIEHAEKLCRCSRRW